MSTSRSVLSRQQLSNIANEYGTPIYIYDAQRIQDQYQGLLNAFKNVDVHFHYACKALTNINVLKILCQLGAGIDCVSLNEVMLAFKAGFKKEDIIFTPNCVSIQEYIDAKDLGVKINIDNISTLEQFGNLFGNTYPICLRFNPHILAGGNIKISTGHIDSKFGISIHQIRHVERIVKTMNINVTGIHMHTGSEIKDTEVFIQGMQVLLNLANHFPDLQFIDLGSGFKVKYKKDDIETDLALLGKRVTEEMQQFEKETGRKLKIYFEPGKYLVSEAGYFVVQANVIKPTPATVFVGVNSGFNHLIRPMLYNAYHRIENISNATETERIYTVVGHICETDTFAWDIKLQEVREKDYLVFYNAGAYGFEMSSNFNSRCKPAEVLVINNEAKLIRKRDNFDDLLRNQIEVL